jgi:hypothetical protein
MNEKREKPRILRVIDITSECKCVQSAPRGITER